jgi:hypothetical protein
VQLITGIAGGEWSTTSYPGSSLWRSYLARAKSLGTRLSEAV